MKGGRKDIELRGDDGQATGGLAVDSNLGWKGADKYVATVPQIFDLWQDPQERYDIFMNNYTERTWTMVPIGQELTELMKTYIKYPPRKLQSMGYDGPIELSKYQKFQYVREMLAKDGIMIRVVDAYSLQPIDAATMLRASEQAPDLRFTRDRLRPAALHTWLADPAAQRTLLAAPARHLGVGLADGMLTLLCGVPATAVVNTDAELQGRVLALVNEHRQSIRVAPLTLHPALCAAAAGHSQDMADKSFFAFEQPGQLGIAGILEFDDLRVGVTNFKVTFGQAVVAWGMA